MFVILLTFSTVVTSFAAEETADIYQVKAGEAVTVTFEFEEVVNVNGTFTFDNPEIFAEGEGGVVSVSVENDPENANKMECLFNPTNGKAAFYAASPRECVVTLELTVAEDAQVGDACTVTFEYEATENGQLPSVPEYQTVSATVVVVDEEGIDYSALLAQIERADALTESDYTADSWAAMKEVYDRAVALIGNAETQQEVDELAEELTAAIDALVLYRAPQTGDIGTVCAILLVATASVVYVINRKKQLAK